MSEPVFAMKPIDKKLLGPIAGNPPTLEWIGLAELAIDPAYQRSMDSSKSRALVIGMVKGWDWSLCQPLVVTRRSDNALFVLDGQHRLEGARQRGDIAHLPCVVLSARTVSAEAAAFVKLNTKRQRLTQSEIFVAMLAHGDPDALAINKLMRETGWALVRHSNTAHYKPGDLACAPMLARHISLSGEAAVRNALVALREAYPDTPVRNASSLLRPLIDIYRDKRVSDPDALIEAIGSVDDPADWLLAAQDVKRENPAYSKREALGEAFLEAMCFVMADWQEAAQ